LELATDWNSPQRKAILDTMRAEFLRQHPAVTINHQHVEAGSSSAQGYTEMMVAQLSAGTIADVVANWAYVPFVEQLADLTKDAPAAGWRKAELLYNPFQQEVNGKLYLLAMSASNSGWIYNKTLFQEAGLREPDETWTTEQALDAARRLTKADRGQYGMLAPAGPWVGWFELLWAAGAGATSPTAAEVLSAERKRTRLGEGAGPDAFEWYANLSHRFQVAPTPAQARDQGVSFAAGNVAMQPFGIYNTGTLAAQIKDGFTWSAMWTPRWPGASGAGGGRRASHLVSEGFVVPKVTKQRGSFDTALRYLLAFYSDPVQKMVAEQRGTMPIARKWIESREYLAAPPLNLDVSAKMLADRQLISGDIGFYHPQFRTWLAALRAETDKVFTGENAPKPGLAAGIAAADRVLAAA
jgi:ABC-type glycerol-3-phosphate transport system substrate-binding protein